MKELTIGTRVYNNGDMANQEHFGTITAIHRNARFGDQYEITPDADSERTKPYCILPGMFSEEFKGHSGTRFVTEEAYNKYKEERIAAFTKRMGK